MTQFSIVTRDEIWSVGPDRALLESRLIHGSALQRGFEIQARDECDEDLRVRCDEAMDRARAALGGFEGRARLIASVRRIGEAVRANTWINATDGALSIVSTPQHFAGDAPLIGWGPGTRACPDYHGVPMVWRNGSASVLLHEAIGHAAEHACAPIAWPRWLTVNDEPEFEVDDVGGETRSADLLRGEPPHSMLRASFADIPLPRMSRLVARQEGQTFAAPARRIEIRLVAGGSFEPLTGAIAIMVSAADLVDGALSTPLQPFTIGETRQSVARAIRSAEGEPARYPGVVCSREGQELVVESYAPAMLTVF